MLDESLHVAGLSSTPAVDGLILIADDADVLFRACQQADELLLRRIGILKLIHLDVAESLAPGSPRLRVIFENLDREQKQVVKVECSGAMQDGLVGIEDVRDIAHGDFVLVLNQVFAREAVILGITDTLANAPRRIVAIAHTQLLKRKLDRAGLCVIIVNREIAWQAEARRFATQEACGERVKRRNPHLGCVAAGGAQQIGDAVLHLLGRFVGERDAQDCLLRHALFDQIGRAIGDHARLARSRTRKDEEWAFGMLHRLALAFV